jgi:hypothetical protein
MQPHYVSRSAIERDNACPRSRFWNTVYAGIGLEPTGTSEDLIIGTALHAGAEILWKSGEILAALAHMQSVSEYDQLSDMWRFWVEAALCAYHKVRHSRMRKTWDVMDVETEVTYVLGKSKLGKPLVLLAKPDLMLIHKLTKMVRYVEFKSTRIMDDRFMKSWTKAVQLAAGQLCYEELGIIVDQVQVAFWCKGVKADGYFRTPFLSAWRTQKPENDRTNDALEYTWEYASTRPQKWKGWERFNVWESNFTPQEWIDKLADEVWEKELPETPELVFDPEQRKDWAIQVMYREGTIADAATRHHELATLSHDRLAQGEDTADYERRQRDLLNEHFPQHTKQCEPAMGYPCPFLAICWNPTIAKAPTATGLYKYRAPHHAIEARALGVEE